MTLTRDDGSAIVPHVPPEKTPRWIHAEIAATAALGRVDLRPSYAWACERLRKDFADYHRCVALRLWSDARALVPIIENLISMQQESVSADRCGVHEETPGPRYCRRLRRA